MAMRVVMNGHCLRYGEERGMHFDVECFSNGDDLLADYRRGRFAIPIRNGHAGRVARNDGVPAQSQGDGRSDYGDIANAMASAGITTLVPDKRLDNYSALHRHLH